MATATTSHRERIETVTTEQVVSYKEVELRLNEKEAQLLADVLDHVGGDPKRSRRELAGDIIAALGSAGVRSTWSSPSDLTGAINFKQMNPFA